LPSLAAAVVVAAWQVAVMVTGTAVFPSPGRVVGGLVELAGRGVLWSSIRDSLVRVGSGYGLALVVGLPLGTAMGWWTPLARALDPAIQLLRPISPIAWIPVAIVLFGVSNLATIFLVFLASFFPIVVSTANGVAGVPEIYRRAGRNFGLSAFGVLRRVIVPAALPRMLVGLRIGVGIAWLVVVAAEMVAVDSGLGFVIIDARNAGQRYDLVVGAMLLIGVIGLALDLLIRRLERLPSLRWGFRSGS
jgi:NitT/TauT family transport system permease protein